MKFVVITEALKQYYFQYYPIQYDKIFVAPDGADPIADNCKPIYFNNRGKRLQVGYVGHLYKGRGLDLIEKLAYKCTWADFHIIGGYDKDIKMCISNFQTSNNIFFHGYKKPSEAERYRLGCDILLAPYQYEVPTSKWMSPLKLFEYMATGKTIICSDIPVLREILKHNYNAYLCDPEDVNSWESALIYLCKNKDECIHLGNNAKNDFTNNYTWFLRAQKILSNVVVKEHQKLI